MVSSPIFLSLAALSVLLASPLTAAPAADQSVPPRLPVEDFFRQPEKTAFRLSPNGKMYSWLEPWKDRFNVMVAPVDGSQPARRVTAATERDIRSYGWVNDETIVYAQDFGGDENYHLYVTPADGSSAPKDLTPFKGVRAGVLDDLEDDPEHILILMNKENPEVFDAYRANVKTGELTRLTDNPGNVVGWGTDNDGHIRLAYVSDGLTSRVLYRENESEKFREIFSSDFKDSIEPVGFTGDNKKIYLLSNLGHDYSALYLYDPQTKKQDLICSFTDRDVSGILWSQARRTLLGVSWYTDRSGRLYFDEEARDFYEALKARFPGMEVGITDTSKNERRIIVVETSDKVPGRLYYYDKDKPGEFKPLADLYPWLKEEHMASMKPISFTARDGLTIHGYLTLPLGRPAKNLPVVVNPHGGPEARDTWGYDPEVQLLANRGMAVLQVNYRVSTGYGKAFWKAGFKQWGQKQQDDITDGVKWLISEGIADPKRIGIYGGSYGGYATLMGLIKTPELYRCGVDYVGVANLFTLFKSIPSYWRPMLTVMKETIGDPKKDKVMFQQYSPVYHADKINVPLFIAQGANDPRVVKDQSDQMVKAMKARGIEVEYLVKNNEGHGFSNVENRLDFYRQMSDFLERHLTKR